MIPIRASGANHGDFEHTVAISEEPADVIGSSWASFTDDPDGDFTKGLAYAVPDLPFPEIIRSCDDPDLCWTDRWQSDIAMQANGRLVITWAEAEEPNNLFSAFNVRLQSYDSAGQTIGDEVVINDTTIEVNDSSQESPSVALDESGNIVVAWVGAQLEGCTSGPIFQIFARRLFWDGANTPVFVDAPFRVDSSSGSFQPETIFNANPAVALAQTDDPDVCGRFIIAWNARDVNASPQVREIHAQYFAADGRPIATEFRVNQDTSETDSGVNTRRLADSAQHTLDYGPEGQVVVAWTAERATGPRDVYFTLLPPDYSETLAEEQNCLKGDVDVDGLVNGLDIQPFVDLMLGNQSHCLGIASLCGADCDCDGDLDIDDIPPFVVVLLGGDGCTGFDGCEGLPPGSPVDCDEDDVPDATQIHLCHDGHWSCSDCNDNGILDTCEIIDEAASDVDENLVIDACESDCNGNDIPDPYEIAAELVDDCNANGIPDECELAYNDCDLSGVPDDCEPHPDCNNNGIADVCESDCDSNGEPDDCDVDPTDPDGDEWVDPDCNGNLYPDACDLELPPPFGSFDCNENGVPDECDVASQYSQDANQNGIPDECEQQSMMGGGMQSQSASGGGATDQEFDADTAWAEFYQWYFAQDWSEMSGGQRFGAVAGKLSELGLPLGAP